MLNVGFERGGVVTRLEKRGDRFVEEPYEVYAPRVLAGIARHPNISGYVLIGLGCEVNQVERLVKDFHLDHPQPGEAAPAVMNIQAQGGIHVVINSAGLVSFAPSLESAGDQAGAIPLVSASAAPVGETLPMRSDFSAMLRQTSDWSERCEP